MMRNYRLTPNNVSIAILDTEGSPFGEDFTQYLISAVASYSSFSENGMILRTGEIRLAKRVSGLLPLSEFMFMPGCEVICKYINSSITRRTNEQVSASVLVDVPALGGGLFIEKINTSEDDTEIILQVSCGLSICNGATPSDFVTCVKDPHEELDLAVFVNTIVDSVGLDKLTSGIDPQMFLLNKVKVTGTLLNEVASSPLALLGQLVFMHGRNMYVNEQGILSLTKRLDPQLTFTSTAPRPEIAASSNKLLKFFRIADSSILPTDYRVETYECENRTANSSNTSNIKDGDIITTTLSDVDEVSRTIEYTTTTRDTTLPYFFSSKTVVVEQYELEGAGGDTIGGTTKCSLYDPGRLLSRVTTVSQPIGIARAEFIAARRQAEAEDPTLGTTVFSETSIITLSQTTETWEYKYKDALDVTCEKLSSGSSTGIPPLLASGSSTGETLKYKKIVLRDAANMWPEAGNPRLGRDGGATFVFDNGLLTSEVYNEVYNKIAKKRDNTWEFSLNSVKSRILTKPSVVQAQAADITIPLSTVVSNAYQLIGEKSEFKTDTAPPEPTRYTSLKSRECKPKCYTKPSLSKRVSLKKPKYTETLSFPDYYIWNELKDIQEFVNGVDDLRSFRSNSYSLVGSFDALNDFTDDDLSWVPETDLPDALEQFAVPRTPLAEIFVRHDGREHHMFADSISAAISPTEMYWGCSGLLIGALALPSANPPGGSGDSRLPPNEFIVNDVTILDPRDGLVIADILNTNSGVYFIPE